MAEHPLFDLHTSLKSRSISFENPTGAPGQGGQTSNPLGVGRKGRPAEMIQPGETVALCDVAGMGTLRHIWMTTRKSAKLFRSVILRAWWDGQEHPSIEAPLGDFFGFAHGRVAPYQSAVHSVGQSAAMNFWLPMPFTENAYITLTNEYHAPIPIYYQIDYTLGDSHPDDVGRLHVLFRRENPTTLTQDFVLLPERHGIGRYLGAVIGVRPLDPRWWGEGEVKIFLDGDQEFATIVGTGSEDYVGLSYGLQPTPFLYQGCSFREKDNDSDTGRISMYRWHLPDPIIWHENIHVTIQQIGMDHSIREARIETFQDVGEHYYERADDWSTATFWYENTPSAPLSELPSLEARIADLD
ncbi:MAG: glycoside hydrolase family 172 protein [Pseudomonadota bacterium]